MSPGPPGKVAQAPARVRVVSRARKARRQSASTPAYQSARRTRIDEAKRDSSGIGRLARAALPARRARRQHVARAAPRLDHRRLAPRLELAAEAVDVDLDRVRERVV